jgi:predicted dehydrogenase
LRDPDDLFREKLDALFICTPPYCRGELEHRAIDTGTPFFVEKPIGVTARQVQGVLERLEQRKMLNAVGYMNRYRNSVSHVRSLLGSRHIIGIAAHWVGKKYAVPWWLSRELSGGPFNEQATHLMDLFRYFTGQIEIVNATAHAPEGVATTVAALLRLQSGGLGSFFYSCEAKDKDILISIETPDGVLELRGWDLELARNTIDGSLAAAESKPIFEKETHAFLRAVSIDDGGLILADFAEAYQTQVAMDSVVQVLRSFQEEPKSV